MWSLVAIVAVAGLAVVPVWALIGAAALRVRDGRAGPWCLGLTGAALTALVWWGLAVVGAAAPDALDRLPDIERAALAPALAASPQCGTLPLTRVLRVDVRAEAGRGKTISFTCGLTHLGLPRFSGRAQCAEGGRWSGGGWLDLWRGGSCAPFRPRP